MATALQYFDDSRPGITRRQVGGKWQYYAPDGTQITSIEEIERLNRIGLPPAYERAWFAPDPSAHLLAIGYDAKGRKQYRYHSDFRTKQESAKFDRMIAFAAALPVIRKRVEADLKEPKLTRERAIASIVRLLDTGAIRVGNDVYARENKSFGATTLRMRHAQVKGETIHLRFKAKSGKDCAMRVTDRSLARFVRAMQDLPGQSLFQFVDADGVVSPVGSSDVNAYLNRCVDEGFTAKDFRTWHASAIAFEVLATASADVTIKALSEQVAARLNNTPAIARKSYIHPALIALAEKGQETFRARLKRPRATRWLSSYERGLGTFLKKAPRAKTIFAKASKPEPIAAQL